VDDSNPTNLRLHPSGPIKIQNGAGGRRGSAAHGQRGSSTEIGTSFPTKGVHYPKLYNAQVVDFSTLERAAKQSRDDPLPDSLYHKPHRRAERQEKQLRNIEKERAQHEKQHLERLLEGLIGPDWLKVMGVSGITESEKKEYEPKRDIFIREVAGLVEKFKVWKEEEKRRKAEKEQAVLAEEAEEQADEEDVEDVPDEEFGQLTVIDTMSDGDPPDYSDVDAWAARQLHQEAIGATSRSSLKKQRLEQPQIQKKLKAPPPPQPFTSFYSKPYLRAAAIGNHRRSGRSVTAFGLPIPDMPQRDFMPPLEVLNPEVVKARERSKRRLKRETKDPKEYVNK
jgi:Something about silencing, SAS, complex subunit 4